MAVVPPIHVHVHIHTPDPAVLDRLTSMEATMSEIPDALAGLTTAIADVKTRVDEDVAHLQDIIVQMSQTAVDDAEKIATLMAEADTVAGTLKGATAQLTVIDPLADFPQPPAEEPPAEG